MSNIKIKNKANEYIAFASNNKTALLMLGLMLITVFLLIIAKARNNQPLPACSIYSQSELSNLPVRCYSYFKINSVSVNATIRVK